VLIRILFSMVLIFYFASCVTSYTRLPSSVVQIYANKDIQQSLLLMAQHNVLVHIPDATTRESEKAVVDLKCRQISRPLWSDKLAIYLNEFRKRPELLSRIHVLEIKRGDRSEMVVHKDLDGAVTLSIQFVKFEHYERVTPLTKIPCSGSVAEYLGRDLVKTQYDFPSIESFLLQLMALPEKKSLPRFQFANEFLSYLAERGAIFKFSHDMSFEKTSQGKFVIAELLNKLAEDVKQPFHQHVNYWFKQINSESTQAQLIQMFAAIQDKELKAGVRVDLKNETLQKAFGEADLTYLFITYNVENERLNSVNLQQLEKCLQSFTQEMSGVKFRKPAAADKESYLRPGYSCILPPVL